MSIDKYRKVIVYQDSEEPYRNEYSNSHKKNIIWGVLQDYGLSTDNDKKPIYYSPQFLKNKCADFIGKKIILNHQDNTKVDKEWVVGRGVDVVYNNNGIVLPSGDVVPADSRFWYCVDIDTELLNKYGIHVEELEKNCSFSTHFSNATLEEIGDQVNGNEYEDNVRAVVDADVSDMALLYKIQPRFNVCQNLYNGAQFEEKKENEKNISKTLELNCNEKKELNIKNMAEENEKNLSNDLSIDDIKVAIKDVLKEELKNVVKEVLEENNKQLQNEGEGCEKKPDSLENEGEDKQDVIISLLKDIKEALKANHLENEDEEQEEEKNPLSNQEAQELSNSYNSKYNSKKINGFNMF